MPRKWMTLAGSLAVLVAFSAAFSAVADDDDSPLHKIMEKVNKQNLALTKGVRTEVAYKKAVKDGSLTKAADELISLGKESRPFKEPAEKQKKTQEEWTKLTDDFVKKTTDFRDLIAKSDTTQEKAKTSHNAVKASCAACHMVFKVDD